MKRLALRVAWLREWGLYGRCGMLAFLTKYQGHIHQRQWNKLKMAVPSVEHQFLTPWPKGTRAGKNVT
ncbi:hypothetical protein VTH06DRAFT_7003 [Thermothelomyces fergusii]